MKIDKRLILKKINYNYQTDFKSLNEVWAKLSNPFVIVKNNKTNQFNEQEVDFILKSLIAHENGFFHNSLLFTYLTHPSTSYSLILNDRQLNYLIDHSNLFLMGIDGNVFISYLANHHHNKIELNNQQLKKIFGSFTDLDNYFLDVATLCVDPIFWKNFIALQPKINNFSNSRLINDYLKAKKANKNFKLNQLNKNFVDFFEPILNNFKINKAIKNKKNKTKINKI